MELKSPPCNPLMMSSPCLPSLRSAFLSTPYDDKIMKSITECISGTEDSLLRNYVSLSFDKCADVLERQRGPAYGIGKFSSREDPMFIGKQVKEGISIDEIPTHNLGPEHLFGDCRQRLDTFGTLNFDCMREGLTISHNRDLAFRDHSWKSKEFNSVFNKAREKSQEFEK